MDGGSRSDYHHQVRVRPEVLVHKALCNYELIKLPLFWLKFGDNQPRSIYYSQGWVIRPRFPPGQLCMLLHLHWDSA
jgi:uncharacterized protein (DUF3820 family)